MCINKIYIYIYIRACVLALSTIIHVLRVCMYINMHTYMCKSVFMHACMHAYMHVCLHGDYQEGVMQERFSCSYDKPTQIELGHLLSKPGGVIGIIGIQFCPVLKRNSEHET